MDSAKPFAVCFSGHRPEKLPQEHELRMLLSLLYSEIKTAAADGAVTFYTGCAQGIDLWAADMVLMMKRLQPALRLICVQPFAQQGDTLSGIERYHYQTVLQAASEVICLSPQYYRGCYRARNQYMVRHSQRLISIVTDMQSGTGQTIRLAKHAGLDVRILSLETAVQQTKPAHEYFTF